jgi:hypothetical protein
MADGLLSSNSSIGLSEPRYLEKNQKITESSFKGKGYFGAIPTKDGSMMTEYSSAFDVDGKTVSYPLVVPTLTANELNLLRTTGEATPEIEKKAQQFALDRIAEGKNPFASPKELRYPLPEGFNPKIFNLPVNSMPTNPVYSDPLGDTTR